MADAPAKIPDGDGRLSDPALRWIDALGLGPVFVRRTLLQESGNAVPAESAAEAPPPQPATRPSTPPRSPVDAERPVPSPPPARSPQSAAAAPCGSEREQAIAQMDWSALREATEQCRACKLGGIRHRAVFGTGATEARWMIVGEAPGAEEDRQGEPFVGAAGQLLDQMLAAVDLDRRADDPAHAVYIANVLKCRPPANRNPMPDEVAQCSPLLQRQIALLQPRIILALGRFAAQTLLDTQAPISRLRGQVHQYAGVPTIVSYHPAYLLRNPADKARVWRDLCLARDTFASAG